MSTRVVIGLVGALAIALIALSIWRWAAEPGPVAHGTGIAPASAPRPAGADEPLATPPATPLATPAQAEHESPEVQREEPAPRDVVLILAVAAETGAPVPGADVWYGPQTLAREHGARRQTDHEDVLRRHGRHARTDERGEVRLPAGQHATVAVRKGDLCGIQRFAGDAGESVRVELEVQRSIAIQVVDGEGRPVAGVPVQIGVRDPERPEFPASELWSGTTGGEEGLAVLHQFDSTRIARYAGDQEVDLTEGKWVVALLPFPLAEPVEVGFHPGELPVEPVRLVLPPTGSMRIDLVDPGGGLFEGDAWVNASMPVERLGNSPRWQRRGSWYVRGGSQLVPHVGLDLELRLAAHHQDYEDTVLDVHGPRSPGEELRFALQLSKRRFAFIGRALDAGGVPLLSSALQLELDADNGGRGREKIRASGRTDQDGRFRIHPRHLDEAALLHGLRIETDPHAEEEVLFAEIPLAERSAGEGEIDLGDVRMTPAPVAVSGRVVDAGGEPVYWAMIDVFWEEELPPNVQPRTRRRYDYGLRAYSRLDGTFGIYGELEPRPWRLEVMKSPFVPSAPIAIRQGDEGLVIVLHRTGALEGSVLVDEGVSPQSLEIEVRREGQAPRGGWRAGTYTPHPNGAFRIGELEPGAVDLLLHLDVENGPVHEVRGVLVEPGGTSEDPRLSGIDLRGRLHAFRFEVAGEDGQPVTSALLGFRPAEESGDMRRLVLLEDGAGTFVSPWRRIDAEVRAHGWRPELLEGVTAGSRIRLRRGIPLLARLAPDLELPEAPLALRLALIPQRIYRKPGEHEHTYSGDGRDRRWRLRWDRDLAGTFGASRELLFFLPEEGSYEHEWSLLAGTTSAGVRNTPSRIYLEIADTEATQVLDLTPDLESYQQTLQQLRDRAGD